MSNVLLPGSYDPITVGHLDIIKRCSLLFDNITVLISKNSSKNYMLCSEKRLALAEDAVKSLPNVKVDIYDGLLTDYVKANDIDLVVKGIRNESDYVYEQNMASANKLLSKSLHDYDFETVFMPCSKEYSDVSSSLVRLILQQGGNVSHLVPNNQLLKELISK